MKIEDNIRAFIAKKEKKKKFAVTADEVIDYWRGKDWTTNSGKRIKSAAAAINVVNSFKVRGISITPSAGKRRLENVQRKLGLKNEPNKKYSEEDLQKILNNKVLDVYEKLPKLLRERTIYERKYEEVLKISGTNYYVQMPLVINSNGNYYVTYPDFVLPDEKRIIEINGEVHNEESVKQWDGVKKRCWEKMGYKVTTILNGDLEWMFEKPEPEPYDDVLAWEYEAEKLKEKNRIEAIKKITVEAKKSKEKVRITVPKKIKISINV